MARRTLVRAGVVLDTLLFGLVQQRKEIGNVIWHAVPPFAWDRVADPEVARIGWERIARTIDRSRTTPIAANEALLEGAARHLERAAVETLQCTVSTDLVP